MIQQCSSRIEDQASQFKNTGRYNWFTAGSGHEADNTPSTVGEHEITANFYFLLFYIKSKIA